MPFKLRDIWSVTSKAIINVGKKVGIGTTQPQYDLDVNGDISATTIFENGKLLEDKYVENIGREKFTDILISDIPEEIQINQSDLFENQLAVRFKFDKHDFLLNASTSNQSKHNYIQNLYQINLLPNPDIDSTQIYGNYYIIGDASAYFNGINTYYVFDNNQNIHVDEFSNQNTNLKTEWNKLENITLSFWIRLEYTEQLSLKYTLFHTKTQVPFDDTSNNLNAFFKLYIQDYKLFVDWKSVSSNVVTIQTINQIFKINEWFHITLIIQKSDNNRYLKLFVNGVHELFDNDTVSELNNNDTRFNIIGASHEPEISNDISFYNLTDNFTEHFHGYIDDFRIYYRAFTFDDIKNNIIGSILNIKSDGISSFGNKGIHFQTFQNKIGIHTKNPQSNLHVVGNTLITDGNLKTEFSELTNIDNTNLDSIYIQSQNITSTSNISSNLTVLNNAHIINNLYVDGTVISDIESTNILCSSNIVEDFLSAKNIRSSHEIVGNSIECFRLKVTDPDGFEVTTTNKFDNIITNEFIEIDFHKNKLTDTHIEQIYEIHPRFGTSLIVTENFKPLTYFTCKFEEDDGTIIDGTCNFTDDYISMLNHQDNVFRYQKDLNQSISLNQSYIEHVFNDSTTFDEFTLISWIKLSINKTNSLFENNIVKFDNLQIRVKDSNLIIVLGSQQYILDNFFNTFDEWFNLSIRYTIDNHIYIYVNLQLVFYKNDFQFNRESLNIKFNFNFNNTPNYFNIYDSIYLWNDDKFKNPDNFKSIQILFLTPIFYDSNGIGLKNNGTYSGIKNRITNINSIIPLVDFKANYTNITTPLKVSTNYTELPLGSLIVNDVPHDVQYLLYNRHNNVVITNTHTYGDHPERVSMITMCMKPKNDTYTLKDINKSARVEFYISKWGTYVDDLEHSQFDIALAHETSENSIITIKSDKKVGINNINPSSNLDIVGDTRINGDLNVQKNVYIQNTNTNTLISRDTTTLRGNIDANTTGSFIVNGIIDATTINVHNIDITGIIDVNRLTLEYLTVNQTFTANNFSFTGEFKTNNYVIIFEKDAPRDDDDNLSVDRLSDSLKEKYEQLGTDDDSQKTVMLVDGSIHVAKNISFSESSSKMLCQVLNVAQSSEFTGNATFKNGIQIVSQEDDTLYYFRVLNGNVQIKTLEILGSASEVAMDFTFQGSTDGRVKLKIQKHSGTTLALLDSDTIITNQCLGNGLTFDQSTTIPKIKVLPTDFIDITSGFLFNSANQKIQLDLSNSLGKGLSLDANNRIKLVEGNTIDLLENIKVTKDPDQVSILSKTRFVNTNNLDIESSGDFLLSIEKDNTAYACHIFTNTDSNDMFIKFNIKKNVDILIVGGGGAGGMYGTGGGGGAGGVLHIRNLPLNGEYKVFVGKGGDSTINTIRKNPEDSESNDIIDYSQRHGNQSYIYKNDDSKIFVNAEGGESGGQSIEIRYEENYTGNTVNDNVYIPNNQYEIFASGGGGPGPIFNKYIQGGQKNSSSKASLVRSLIDDDNIKDNITNYFDYYTGNGGDSFVLHPFIETDPDTGTTFLNTNNIDIYVSAGGGGASENGKPGIAYKNGTKLNTDLPYYNPSTFEMDFTTTTYTQVPNINDDNSENGTTKFIGKGGDGVEIDILEFPMYFGGGGGGTVSGLQQVAFGGLGGGGKGMKDGIQENDPNFYLIDETFRYKTVAEQNYAFITTHSKHTVNTPLSKLQTHMDGLPGTGGGGGAGIAPSNSDNKFFANNADFVNQQQYTGGNGGDGIVIFRYKIEQNDQVNVTIYGNLTVLGSINVNDIKESKNINSDTVSSVNSFSDNWIGHYYQSIDNTYTYNEDSVDPTFTHIFKLPSDIYNSNLNDMYLYDLFKFHLNMFDNNSINTLIKRFDTRTLNIFNTNNFNTNTGGGITKYSEQTLGKSTIQYFKTNIYIEKYTSLNINLPEISDNDQNTYVNDFVAYLYINGKYISKRLFVVQDYKDTKAIASDNIYQTPFQTKYYDFATGMHKIEIILYELIKQIKL